VDVASCLGPGLQRYEPEAEAARPDAELLIVDGELATIKRTGQHWLLAELRQTCD
jgi:hypothetical protein